MEADEENLPSPMANSAPPCFFQNSVSAEAENVAVSSAATENSEVFSAMSEIQPTTVNSPGGSSCPSLRCVVE